MKFIGFLIEGSWVTLQVFFLTLLFSLPLGLLVAFGRMSRIKLLNQFVKIYIDIMRGTPLILQLIVVYFGPYYLFGLNIDRFLAAIVAFVINYAAYFSEIYRGGIQSIPRGQYEAAEVLGFSKVQTFTRIILPQVIKRILPPISNEVITLVKDTALVQVLGVSELFRVAKNESSRIASTTPLFIAGAFYFVMNWIVTKAFHIAERKLDYYR
ncbi:MAG: amino acid ABC transporter permease [Acetivibrionales bacterium]